MVIDDEAGSVVIEPTAHQLADIALSAADSCTTVMWQCLHLSVPLGSCRGLPLSQWMCLPLSQCVFAVRVEKND